MAVLISWSYNKITESWLKVYADEIKLAGMPICVVCKRSLRIGSLVDSKWPYFNEFNWHVKCKE